MTLTSAVAREAVGERVVAYSSPLMKDWLADEGWPDQLSGGESGASIAMRSEGSSCGESVCSAGFSY